MPERPGQLYKHTWRFTTYTKLQCARSLAACTSWVAAATGKPPLRQQFGGAHTLMICGLLGVTAVSIGPRWNHAHITDDVLCRKLCFSERSEKHASILTRSRGAQRRIHKDVASWLWVFAVGVGPCGGHHQVLWVPCYRVHHRLPVGPSHRHCPGFPACMGKCTSSGSVLTAPTSLYVHHRLEYA